MNSSLPHSYKIIAFINRFVFLSTLLIISCNAPEENSKEILEEFKKVDSSLQSANTVVTVSSEFLYDSLEKKFASNALVLDSIKWLKIFFETNKSIISSIKSKFKLQAGIKETDSLFSNTKSDFAITNNFFIKDKNGNEIFTVLKKIDSLKTSIKIMTENTGATNFHALELKSASPQEWTHLNFYNIPPVAAITIISKFENDIRIFEKTVFNRFIKN